ncbi:MAG TPA: carboxypeptidase M32 [Bacilli bacterium]|nr:MAG: putative metalloprotease YpwA [Tenericutes bacterium ADurb.BinA124]HNZ50971.1 carboxypeptidase M32 [Bacilli bacterium]HPX84520.1 carboxypeptidase M32 [Bacilli bacterium]HQC74730.1 carboxypeptidase M32 [Bacilli bacterium]
MENLIKQYENLRKKMKAYQFANYLASWDASTEAPKGCFANRSIQMGVLSEEAYKLQTSEETSNIVDELFAKKEQLEPILKHEIEETKRSLDNMKKIPMNEYVEFMTILSDSQQIWAEAKKAADWSKFAPTLEKIVAYLKKYVQYLETDRLKGYDVLLNDFERDFLMEDCDLFFDALKRDLVPFVKKVLKKPLVYQNHFENATYPVEKQKQFIYYLQDVMGFDRNRGLMKESEHPFTSGFGSSDVRFTVHYYENNLTSAIFSAIHEMGHAIYEQQVDSALEQTNSGGGASMALHESQSRFYENIIGRSKEFWKVHFPKLKKTFPKQLKGITLNDFHQSINRGQASLIRIEADELTYAIHIMLRYDIEKALFNNEITVNDLPRVWNEKMKEYLDLDVPNDKEGVLQDVHWAFGGFGYFPSYALGSAYAAQMLATMKKDFPVFKSLKQGTTKAINSWFKERLHRYGATQHPKALFENVVKEKFQPQYYINYLIEKYSQIYNL